MRISEHRDFYFLIFIGETFFLPLLFNIHSASTLIQHSFIQCLMQSLWLGGFFSLLCLHVISDNMNIQGLTLESRLLLFVCVSNCAE